MSRQKHSKTIEKNNQHFENSFHKDQGCRHWTKLSAFGNPSLLGIGFGTNVANWAHGVGLIVGLAVGYASSVIRR